MLLTSDRARIQRLLDHTKAATEWIPQWQAPDTNRPGLLLVGDQGVYFMDNTKAHLLQDGTVASGEARPGTYRCFVCYADQVNPITMPFSEWYSNKQVYWGGDDGSQFFPAVEIETWMARTPGDKLHLNINPKEIALLFPRKPAKLKQPLAKTVEDIKNAKEILEADKKAAKKKGKKKADPAARVSVD